MSTLPKQSPPRGRRPPGPRGHPLVGSLPEFARDVLGFFTACGREHGDLAHFRLAASEVFFLQNPQDIETLLLTQRANFIKHTFFFRHVTAIFGNGLLTIYFSPWVLHRDPRWFEEPERFRPERWLDGSTARLPKYVFLPFGGGPRVCIGERFAMMETVLVLAALLRRFRFEPAGPEPLPFPSITLRPDRPVLMRLVARE